LVVAALLFITVLSGCQEGYSRQDNMSSINKVAFQPTGTGFWHPGQR